jgi:hypothetical protein
MSPAPEEYHGLQRVGAMMNEADIYGPRNGRANLNFYSLGTDVNDDCSGCALMRPGLADEAHGRRLGGEITERKIAASHELRREGGRNGVLQSGSTVTPRLFNATGGAAKSVHVRFWAEERTRCAGWAHARCEVEVTNRASRPH